MEQNIEMGRAEKIALLIKKNVKILIGAGFALIVFFVALGFLEYKQAQKNSASTLAAEEIEQAYKNYLQADKEGKAEKAAELQFLIDEAIAGYEGFYAQMRALDVQAFLYENEEEYEKAAEAWITLSETFPESYMAAVALANAAASRENSGDLKAAMDLYKRIEKDYRESSADMPEILFNLGRLSEETGDAEQAISWYSQIESPSLWLNLAKSRIIAINTGA